MADKEQLKIIRRGSATWNRWRIKILKSQLGRITKWKLFEPDLTGADLTGANLCRADLTKANLAAATLIDASLSGANLNYANLSKANLTGAGLLETTLIGADLAGANLTDAMFGRTIFGDANLTDVLGLDACLHAAPSILDHATLVRSGMLPLPFLRGCGLPDSFINYLPSLLHHAIQYNSCFISYSTKDQDFAARLYTDLQNKGVRCWFAPHDIQGGKYVHGQIDNAIQVHDRFLLILSEASIHSEWVKTEISKARKREIRENRRMLFPVRLIDFETLQQWECFDADIGKDSAREIREYYVPDFSKWKDNDSYQVEFEKLLRDLKTEAH
jgi:TIR domain/Pentapeptide repeats (8 copies)